MAPSTGNYRRNTAGLRRGGGRPKGVPNRNSREIKEAARALVEDEAYVASLKRRVIAGKAPHMETLLFHYAYGKPKEQLELSGHLDVPQAVTFVVRQLEGAENRT